MDRIRRASLHFPITPLDTLAAPPAPVAPRTSRSLDHGSADALNLRHFTMPSSRLAAMNALEALDSMGSMESEDATENNARNYAGYFREIGSGYRINIDHMMVEPMICQPTPRGLALLVNDFVTRTGHDLRVEDQQGYDEPVVSRCRRFMLFSQTMPADIFHQPGPVGVILTMGQSHAIPVLFVRKEDVNYVLIFDSNSGQLTRGYRPVGDFFKGCRVLLNVGTRQADEQSCITDAFEILCRAFTVENLIDKVTARIIEEEEPPPRVNSRFRASFPQVENFQLFRMPEELCFTAQITKFVTQSSGADLAFPIKDEKGQLTTLENFLRSKKSVVIHNQRRRTLGINSYLHDVSIEHKKRIMELVDQRRVEL